jgi:hypothetical protein
LSTTSTCHAPRRGDGHRVGNGGTPMERRCCRGDRGTADPPRPARRAANAGCDRPPDPRVWPTERSPAGPGPPLKAVGEGGEQRLSPNIRESRAGTGSVGHRRLPRAAV